MGGGTGDSIDAKIQDKDIRNMHMSKREKHQEILFDGLTRVNYKDYKKEQESKENYNPKQNIFQRIKNYFK